MHIWPNCILFQYCVGTLSFKTNCTPPWNEGLWAKGGR